jgi:hypothetical protein
LLVPSGAPGGSAAAPAGARRGRGCQLQENVMSSRAGLTNGLVVVSTTRYWR